jgi:hypothetical protein
LQEFKDWKLFSEKTLPNFLNKNAATLKPFRVAFAVLLGKRWDSNLLSHNCLFPQNCGKFLILCIQRGLYFKKKSVLIFPSPQVSINSNSGC